MKVYLYDDETKEFLREEEAFVDPLETKKQGKKVYLLPANATFKQPKETKRGKAIVFNGEEWVLVDDNRGKFTIKDNQIQEIKTLDPVEKVLTDSYAKLERNLGEAISLMQMSLEDTIRTIQNSKKELQ